MRLIAVLDNNTGVTAALTTACAENKQMQLLQYPSLEAMQQHPTNETPDCFFLHHSFAQQTLPLQCLYWLQNKPRCALVLFGIHSLSATLLDYYHIGVVGFLNASSSPAQLRKCLNIIRQDQVYTSPRLAQYFVQQRLKTEPRLFYELTDRGFCVACFIAQGKSNHDIARCLNINRSTVASHRTRLYHKLIASANQQAENKPTPVVNTQLFPSPLATTVSQTQN